MSNRFPSDGKMSAIAKQNGVIVFCGIFACFTLVPAIKIKEERTGNNQRFVSMEEIEEKSKYYLKFHKHMGDEEELNEKVKIMGDRFQELYREHGLDAIHDIFEHVDDLELAIGREDRWQAYMAGLVYPRPPEEWRYARHFLAGFVTVFIVAVVMATPFSYKYAKRFLRGPCIDTNDAELVGADSFAEVMIRRMKKRSRKILYKPMLPIFNINTESKKTSEEELEQAKERLKWRILKEAEFKERKKREWEEKLKEVELEMERRKRILLEDDDIEDGDRWSVSSCGSQCQEEAVGRKKTVIMPKNLRKFWGGKIRLAKHKKKRQ